MSFLSLFSKLFDPNELEVAKYKASAAGCCSTDDVIVLLR